MLYKSKPPFIIRSKWDLTNVKPIPKYNSVYLLDRKSLYSHGHVIPDSCMFLWCIAWPDDTKMKNDDMIVSFNMQMLP